MHFSSYFGHRVNDVCVSFSSRDVYIQYTYTDYRHRHCNELTQILSAIIWKKRPNDVCRKLFKWILYCLQVVKIHWVCGLPKSCAYFCNRTYSNTSDLLMRLAIDSISALIFTGGIFQIFKQAILGWVRKIPLNISSCCCKQKKLLLINI